MLARTICYKVAKNTSDEENNECETQVVEEKQWCAHGTIRAVC